MANGCPCPPTTPSPSYANAVVRPNATRRVLRAWQPAASQQASQQAASRHQVEAMESYSMYLGTCYCSILEYIRKYMYVVVDGYR